MSKNHHIITLGSIATSIALVSCNNAIEKKQPNIICITCEDISPYLGVYGDSIANTPNLDKFAKNAIRLTQMHTTIGVSAPSRFSLITGTYSSSMGANNMRTNGSRDQMPSDILGYDVVLPDGIKCFTEYLRQEGYYCTNNSKTDYQFESPLSAWDENGEKAHWKNRDKGQPFFAIHNIFTTHESQIWARANKPLIINPDNITPSPYFPNNETVRRDMAIMYSNIHHMDKQFQLLLDELKAEGELDNTIIIFYSDNGGPLPRQKRQIYRSGTNVPFMISFPDGRNAGEIDERLAMFIDIPATILSLAGIEPPKHMNGKALFGEYASPIDREYVYIARDRMDECRDKQGGVADKQFRYIKNYMPQNPGYLSVGYRLQMPLMRNLVELFEKGELNDVQKRWFTSPRLEEEFYDDINDPHNINNLINNPAYISDIKRLRTEYNRWISEENSLWLLEEMNYRSKMLPNGDKLKLSNVKITISGSDAILSCKNPGASIVYKINDDKNWSLYSKPIKNLKNGDQIQAVSTQVGYENSKPEILSII